MCSLMKKVQAAGGETAPIRHKKIPAGDRNRLDFRGTVCYNTDEI